MVSHLLQLSALQDTTSKQKCVVYLRIIGMKPGTLYLYRPPAIGQLKNKKIDNVVIFTFASALGSRLPFKI